MKIILATRNAGKVRELQALLSHLPVTVLSLGEVDDPPEVEEDEPTLQGNARKKAVTLLDHSGLPSLADDTGLEVDALGGAPGVRSARFAGLEADDVANRARLLRDLSGHEDRSARFRTVIALAGIDGAGGREVVFFEGVCEGVILMEERGSGGFGYDPIFAPVGERRSFAEMTADQKNRISHRGQAMRLAADFLQRLANGTNP